MPENKDIRSDELDLLEFFRRMGRSISGLFKSLLRGLVISFFFLLRKWLPLGLSLMLAAGMSYLMKKSFTSYYKSEMTIRSNSVSNADMIDYINRLHSFCQERNIRALSLSLSLPAESATKVKDIKAFWVIDKNKDGTPDYTDYKNKFNVYDTLNLRMQDRCVVMAKVSSIQDLSIIRDGIISYINTNSYFLSANDLRLAQAKEMQKRLNYDIGLLDSLQKVKYFEETRNFVPEKNSQMVFLQEQKTQLVYEDIYSLFRRRQKLDEEMNLYSDIITLVNDFAIPAKPYTGTLYYARFLVPLFLAITILLLIIISNYKHIKDFSKDY